jgi:hypothetical protein
VPLFFEHKIILVDLLCCLGFKVIRLFIDIDSSEGRYGNDLTMFQLPVIVRFVQEEYGKILCVQNSGVFEMTFSLRDSLFEEDAGFF